MQRSVQDTIVIALAFPFRFLGEVAKETNRLDSARDSYTRLKALSPGKGQLKTRPETHSLEQMRVQSAQPVEQRAKITQQRLAALQDIYKR